MARAVNGGVGEAVGEALHEARHLLAQAPVVVVVTGSGRGIVVYVIQHTHPTHPSTKRQTRRHIQPSPTRNLPRHPLLVLPHSPGHVRDPETRPLRGAHRVVVAGKDHDTQPQLLLVLPIVFCLRLFRSLVGVVARVRVFRQAGARAHSQEVVVDGLHEGVAVVAVEVVEDRVGAVGPPPVVLLRAVRFVGGGKWDGRVSLNDFV